jgi:plasmid stabilization system protein ParE
VKQVIWTRQALEDIEAIRFYVARDSEQYATLLVERLVAAVERAGYFPEAGRIVPEVGDATLREVVHGSYRIVYRLTPEAVKIVTVHHGARLLRL